MVFGVTPLFGIHFGYQRLADVTAKKEFARGRRGGAGRGRGQRRTPASDTVEHRTSCFSGGRKATIRRTAYVQHTSGSSCACVEYLTGLRPIHNTRIALNGEAAAAAARGRVAPRTNRGERGVHI